MSPFKLKTHYEGVGILFVCVSWGSAASSGWPGTYYVAQSIGPQTLGPLKRLRQENQELEDVPQW